MFSVPDPENCIHIRWIASFSRILEFLSISLRLIAEIRDSRFPVAGSRFRVWIQVFGFALSECHSG
ncbi:MAG: hypothetical protein AMS27_05360, partial [Bacteroides sp. SM23_62_1]